MQHIQQEALNRAMVLLKAAGVQYVIVTQDGDQYSHGTLELKPVKPVKTVSARKKLYSYVEIYKDIYATMQPGDVHCFHLPPNAPVNLAQLAKALSGAACHKWGNGSAITSINDKLECVEVLRVQ